MPTKPTVNVTSVVGQSARRYVDTFHDQHKDSLKAPNGRPWWGWREYASNQGTGGAPEPDGFVGSDLVQGSHDGSEPNWIAPFVPEAQFFDFNYKKAAVVLRYDKMLAHDTFYYREYYQAANRIAVEKGWPGLDWGQIPPYTIRAVLGNPPRSPKIAQAFMAGDRWLLGFTDEVNEELANLLHISRHGIPLVREEIAPVAQPGEILQITAEELKQLVAQKMAEIEAAKPRRKHRRTKPLPTTEVSTTTGNAA